MKDVINQQSHLMVDETIKQIQRLVKIDSVRDLDHKSENKPFGPGIDLAIDEFLQMAKEIGMRTFKDPDGYYAYAEVGPEDQKLIGILGHVDVVPIGSIDQWDEAKPFSADIVEDKIIGRGALDDKGPVVINLMAIKMLIDNNYEFKSRVRIIVGGAEETTWECIDKYKKEQEIPQISYSPDSAFPLINAEKTVYQFKAFAHNDYNFSVISDGAYNAVADRATFIGEDAPKLAKKLDELGFEYEQDKNQITVIGKSAHSMECQLGTNAILRLAIAMYEADIHSKVSDFLYQYIKQTTDASLIFGEVLKDDVCGPITLNIGRMIIKDGIEEVGLDSRIPVLVDEHMVIDKYKNIITNSGLEFEQVDILEKLYVDASSDLVKTLMKVYKDITNQQDAKPLSSGGATYSRSWDNCVAFGMVFESLNMIDNMHQPNECLQIKFIQPALEIYANAIYELDNLN